MLPNQLPILQCKSRKSRGFGTRPYLTSTNSLHSAFLFFQKQAKNYGEFIHNQTLSHNMCLRVRSKLLNFPNKNAVEQFGHISRCTAALLEEGIKRSLSLVHAKQSIVPSFDRCSAEVASSSSWPLLFRHMISLRRTGFLGHPSDANPSVRKRPSRQSLFTWSFRRITPPRKRKLMIVEAPTFSCHRHHVYSSTDPPYPECARGAHPGGR